MTWQTYYKRIYLWQGSKIAVYAVFFTQMINNFMLVYLAYFNLNGNIGYKMFVRTLKQLNEMHSVALASKRLSAGKGYWASVGFTTPSNEQDPIKMASFYKESGNT